MYKRQRLYYDNSNKFETTSYGNLSAGQVRVSSSNASTVAFSAGDAGTGFYNVGSNAIGYSANGTQKWNINSAGDLRLVDNVKLEFGASDDLQIYHNGTNTYLENGTGNIFIRNNVFGDVSGDIYIQAKSGENSIICYDDSTVELYYDNSKKFETTTNGVKITGGIQDKDGQLGSSGQVLSSTGTELNWVAATSGPQGAQGVQGATGAAGPVTLASGTKMLFQQTSAPTGWTKQTSHNNKALRVVSGSASSGGSTAFTSVFTSRTPSGSVSVSGSNSGGSVSNHTLTTSRIPSHRHTGGGKGIHDAANGHYGTVSNVGSVAYPLARYTNGTANYDLYYTSYSGSSGSHNHGFSNPSWSGSSSFSGSSMDFAVQYVDVIIAALD